MNERTNLNEVTESIKKLLEEAINRNDFQTFDETLAVVASHSTITDTNNQVKFERFLLDLVILFIIYSQLTACSGKIPVCLKPICLILSVKSL